ncbi:MAG: tRNA (guanosine(46)-N7)-methyltransferase TrmB [Planctomyces sp.]|nr:tRNA (guanosine(46)-N7)-methyltransferase TrmB [Planctomyces sp.]
MRRIPLNDLDPWFQTVDGVIERDGRIDGARLFANDRPLEIDVGCGRGLFVFSASGARPNTNFLGIELDYKEARRAAKRLQKRAAGNARILGGDVFRAFEHIAPGSVEAIHVYFPDPWWKRRHRRRRVFTDRFADACAELIRPGGMLHSWTDVEEYFEVIRSLMDHHARFEALPPPEERPAENDMDYHTSFERKKRKLGMPIYRGQWRRRADV